MPTPTSPIAETCNRLSPHLLKELWHARNLVPPSASVNTQTVPLQFLKVILYESTASVEVTDRLRS